MDKKLWEECVSFHGHECPGLAIGFRASEAAIKKLNLTFSKDEEIVCITENNACGVDAIQYITGCTFGKGNLIFKDKGKQAFTFFRKDTREGVRIVLKAFNHADDRKKWMEYLLNALLEEIFDFKTPPYEIPPKARIYPSIKCEICGEYAGEHRIRLKDGKKVCIDCFGE
ncbi:FmdE family protein [Caldanaerobacter subterraneus]|uniref:Formylmethanofuran dehydrogenase subunit E n=1 Tax=Caldanaerobacter subterraneus subsp. pacificus DSM 12653 TaxID=391606 RepID=A0A0F5PKW5_9THEO|nr:FmdE family protein [Caldanaerobacter subterraneus]KKC29278.1 formylmethanofuran dehydrogenase subunit E [Caldanaerobacter subterraneus subsp. pacificus DSM 12653]